MHLAALNTASEVAVTFGAVSAGAVRCTATQTVLSRHYLKGPKVRMLI